MDEKIRFTFPDETKFNFGTEITRKFKKWLGIAKNDDIDEALIQITGDTYFEMRKLISQCMLEVEALISSGKYKGYFNGIALTYNEKTDIKKMPEDLKNIIKEHIESTWRAMLSKQKIGVEKLGMALREHYGKE